MARKLKTYQTSMGFFDLVIAAPSMKAALAAWGTDRNLFRERVAKEADDPTIIDAAMRRAGVVLRRPVGTSKPFKEDAELPTSLVDNNEIKNPPRGKVARRAKREINDVTDRKAALAYEKEQKKRDRDLEKREAAEARAAERREKTVAKAQAALEDAERENDREVSELEAQRDALAEREKEQKERWLERKGKLEAALRRTRSDG